MLFKNSEVNVFNVKLISTTNDSMKKYENEEGTLFFSKGNCASFVMYISMLTTSTVNSYEINTDTITLNTRNSVYVFEILVGEN